MSTAESSGIRDQIIQHFGDTLDDKVIDECVSICRNFNLSGEDLFFKWEAMSYGQTPRVFNMDSLGALKQHVQRDFARQNKKLQAKTKSSGLMSRNLNARQMPSTSFGRAAAVRPVKEESKSGVQDAMNVDSYGVAPSRVKLVVQGMDAMERKERKYRYMYEKISERSGALDDRIEDIAEIVQKHYGLAELGDPSAESEEEIAVVGRIALDADSSSAGSIKLNEAAMILETSRAMGSGKRVPLRFDTNVRVRGARKGVQGAGFFPGAIVALKGRNGGGGWFLVTEILSVPPPAPPATVSTESDTPFTMCIASGPYTTDGDLKYEAWDALVRKLKATKPAVVLLIGPFVDSAHPLVKNGDLDKTPEELFHDVFVKGLTEVLDAQPGSSGIIVPSVRDILSDHAVFPQCELDVSQPVDPRITFLSNPCRFRLNNITFAVSSVDVLFHLRKEEYFKRASEIAPTGDDSSPHDAMTTLCTQIVHQRSFYPLFPVPLDAMHEVNLDISHSDSLALGEEDDAAPHVIVLPSKLKQFTKNVEKTTVVNPSFITKGTLAMLQIGSAYEIVHGDIVKLA